MFKPGDKFTWLVPENSNRYVWEVIDVKGTSMIYKLVEQEGKLIFNEHPREWPDFKQHCKQYRKVTPLIRKLLLC